MAQKMAMENENVTADVVEATEFPEMSQKYRVMSVPKIVVRASSLEGLKRVASVQSCHTPSPSPRSGATSPGP